MYIYIRCILIIHACTYMYTHIYIPYLMYVLYRNVIILVVGDFFFNKRYYTGDTLLQLAFSCSKIGLEIYFGT